MVLGAGTLATRAVEGGGLCVAPSQKKAVLPLLFGVGDHGVTGPFPDIVQSELLSIAERHVEGKYEPEWCAQADREDCQDPELIIEDMPGVEEGEASLRGVGRVERPAHVVVRLHVGALEPADYPAYSHRRFVEEKDCYR